MNNYIESKKINCFLIFILLTFFSCKLPPNEELIKNPQLVFPKAIEIKILSPNDDTINTDSPSVIWEATGQTNVMAAIFDDVNINVTNDKITNWNKVIWAWHSGMGTGREGSLLFNDGRKVVNGEILYDSLPLPLTHINYYFLAVWAWDQNGIKITYSSRATYFAVQ